MIDFGACQEYPKEFIKDYIEIIASAARGDKTGCIQKSKDIGFLKGEENRQMVEAHVQSILAVGEPFRIEGEFNWGD